MNYTLQQILSLVCTLKILASLIDQGAYQVELMEVKQDESGIALQVKAIPFHP